MNRKHLNVTTNNLFFIIIVVVVVVIGLGSSCKSFHESVFRFNCCWLLSIVQHSSSGIIIEQRMFANCFIHNFLLTFLCSPTAAAAVAAVWIMTTTYE